MPNDVTAIIQDATGSIFFRRDDGTYHFIHGATPIAESDDATTAEDIELLNDRESTVVLRDGARITGTYEGARITGTYEGEPVYAVDHREEAGAGFYYEDDPSEETELLCAFVGARADADFLGQSDRNHRKRDECCIIAQTGELVCCMDGKLTAWSRDDYRIENETAQILGGRHNNAVLGEVVRAVHVLVKPDASYPYRPAGYMDDGAIAEAFDEVYA